MLAAPIADVLRKELKIEVELIPGTGGPGNTVAISQGKAHITFVHDWLGAIAKVVNLHPKQLTK